MDQQQLKDCQGNGASQGDKKNQQAKKKNNGKQPTAMVNKKTNGNNNIALSKMKRVCSKQDQQNCQGEIAAQYGNNDICNGNGNGNGNGKGNGKGNGNGANNKQHPLCEQLNCNEDGCDSLDLCLDYAQQQDEDKEKNEDKEKFNRNLDICLDYMKKNGQGQGSCRGSNKSGNNSQDQQNNKCRDMCFNIMKVGCNKKFLDANDCGMGNSNRCNNGMGNQNRCNNGMGNQSRCNSGMGNQNRCNSGMANYNRGNNGMGNQSRCNNGMGNQNRFNNGMASYNRCNNGMGNQNRRNCGMGNNMQRQCSGNARNLLDRCRRNKGDCLDDSNEGECNQYGCVLSSTYKTPSTTGDREIQRHRDGANISSTEGLMRAKKHQGDKDSCELGGFDFKCLLKKSKDSCELGEFDFGKSFKLKRSNRC